MHSRDEPERPSTRHVVLINAPGRFPTVAPERRHWQREFAASSSAALHCVGLNHAWWRTICAPAFVHTVAEHLGVAELSDMFGPCGSMRESGAAASKALDAFAVVETFRSSAAYLGSVAAIVRHLANINSAQGELAVTLEFGPRVGELDYNDSAAIAQFAESRSLLRSTIAHALATMAFEPAVVCFLATSPVDLAAAAVTAAIVRERWPGAHCSLIDHGFENFSLEPHLAALKQTGALECAFDSIIQSKDDIDVLVPTIIRRALAGDPVRGFVAGAMDAAVAPTAAARREATVQLFPVFCPEPVVYVRTSPKRCYWSRCTFCTQNAKYADPRAPNRQEILNSLDHVQWLAAQGVTNLVFADEAISPSALRALCEEIKRRGLDIRWACRCKFERAFSRDLLEDAAAAGCYEILFGLETISPSLLEKMGKSVDGLDSDGIRRILADMACIGLGVHINLIGGFPGETEAEAQATMDFVVTTLSKHRNATYRLNRFALFPATSMLEQPEAFGLVNVRAGGDMPERYAFELDPETSRRTDAVVGNLPFFADQLHRGLGWSRLRTRPECRTAMDLYFASGHSAIFKTLTSNPMDTAAADARRRGETRRHVAVAGMHVVLTGASGNAGHAIKEALLESGCRVTLLVRRPGQADPRCGCIVGDLVDFEDSPGLFAAADAIVHCASPRSLDRETVLRDEIETTARLIDGWCRGPFIAMSSQTVYGVPKRRLSERSPTGAENWYDLGKLNIEAMLRMESLQRGRGAGISLRLPLVFGVGPGRRGGQYLADVRDALVAGKTFLFADQQAMEECGSVYIGGSDLGRALVAALGIRRPGPYNLASGFVTWRVLIDELAARIGVRPNYAIKRISNVAEHEFRLPHSRTDYDCSRFRRASGFVPQQSLGSILLQFLA